ncbi:MAG: VCBS repeat-containing protein [bacterium]|nr:VCBS repeat-containing protein [bacterium]
MALTWDTGSGAGNSRFGYYGFTGTPAAMFDGLVSSVGGMPSGSMFDSYQPLVQNRLGVASPLTIAAGFQIAGPNGTVSATIQVASTVTTGSNQVRFYVYEALPRPEYPNYVRAVLAAEPFALTAPGQSVTVQRSFAVDPAWDPERLGVIVLVQSDANRSVLQAAEAEADYAGVLTVDAQPDGLSAPWTLTGPGGFSLQGQEDRVVRVFLTGEYALAWGEVPGWTVPVPAVVTVQLEQDGEATLAGLYTGGPFVAADDADLALPGAAARGVAIVDADADGDQDIYVSVRNGANALLLNGGGLDFASGGHALLRDAGAGMSAVWADVTGDGRRDVYLVRDGQANLLLRADGAGGYLDATFGPAGDTGPGTSVAAADYDRDGLLDLYAVNAGAANVLLRGVADMGVGWFMMNQPGIVADTGNGAGAAWGDYDNDGDQDLYLTNRFAANRLFQNGGALGWFNATGTGVLADTGNGHGAAWGDYDNDGDLDLYVANDGQADLLVRNDRGTWALIVGGGLGDVGHGRGVAWGDLDNDGDLDLYLARHGETDLVLRNEGGGSFTRIPLGLAVAAGAAEGVALGDLDGDGDLDAFVANDGGPSGLLLNGMAAGNHWLHLDLTATGANTSAVGARVWLTAGGQRQLREVAAGSGYLSQDSPTVEFGLGGSAVADTLRIRWPDGQQQVVTGLAADRRLHVRQGVPVSAPPAPVAGLRLLEPYPNPFNPATTLRYDLPRSGRVELRVYDVAGRLVRTLRAGEVEAAGRREAVWDGRDDAGRAAAAGAYLVRLSANGETLGRRLLLVK